MVNERPGDYHHVSLLVYIIQVQIRQDLYVCTVYLIMSVYLIIKRYRNSKFDTSFLPHYTVQKKTIRIV